jgi:uncharacterized lipoprotein YddW (UPF0748 family)
MKKFLLLFLILFVTNNIYSQLSNPPKREFRAAWIATVVNLDWPPNAVPETQKQALISILNFLQNTGINTVIFQIRPECDALYQSNYEPWSHYLTGSQGTPPNPFYDPLQFAVEEAHKRGMEIHAWFNPYRAVRAVGSYSLSNFHVSVQHPDWIITKGTLKILDPGKQAVRNHVSNVVMDVVRRYDVDGIHIDDYFYPYPPDTMKYEDTATFRQESRGFTYIKDWRRDNINILLRQLMDSVNAVKPYVKFGVSPFGIWRSGIPSGTSGLDAYNVIYCDAMAWLRMGSIDYLTPQLYWQLGGSQDYLKLANWWADSTFKYNRHLYPGHASYKIGTNSPNYWSASEVPNQIRINRNNPKIDGSVFFRANFMTGLGFNDSLRTDLYRYKSLLPVMQWKDTVKPNVVQNLRFDRVTPGGPYGLLWDLPLTAPDGDSAYRYVVYRFTTPTITQNDLNNPANILTIEPGRVSFPPVPTGGGSYFFVVTALDRNWNESAMSSVLQVGGPAVPQQVFPANTQGNLTDTIKFRWNTANLASSYVLYISLDPSFNTNLLINGVETQDTHYTVTGFQGQKTYYWRLFSKNAGGLSNYSAPFSFTTGFPEAPAPASPPHGSLNQPLNVTLKWLADELTQSYNLQVASSLTFNSQTILMEFDNITDTLLVLGNLENNKNYFWRVNGVNQFGTSQWSVKFGFKTESTVGLEYEETIPSDYALMQNYPNPFNPSTRISFEMPAGGYTTLKVYDAVGNEVADLIDENLPAGKYSLNFNAAHLSSGVYIYVLRSGERMMSNKMILMK